MSEEHGPHTVLRALRFVIFRLRSHELAEPIAFELEYCLSELESAQHQYEEALTRRLAATAEVSFRDEGVDEAMMTLAEELLRLVNGNRNDTRYTALFPVAPSEAMASTAGNRQHEFVRRVIEQLDADVNLSSLASHAAKLKQQQALLEDAIATRDACFDPETKAARKRSEAIDQACRSYNRSFPRLQLHCSNGALIDSIYPTLPAGRRREDEGHRRL